MTYSNLRRRCSPLFFSASFFIAPLIFAAGVPSPTPGEDSQEHARTLDARVNLESSFLRAAAARPGALQAGAKTVQRQSAGVAAAVRDLQRKQPGLEVQVSSLTGAATSVSGKNMALTGPAPGRLREDIARDFLRTNVALFGLGSTDLADLAVVGDSGGSGLRMLRMEQRIDGRPIFQSETRFVFDRDGRLFKSTGQLVPDARNRVDAFDPGQLIDAPRAIVQLLASTGKTANADAFEVRAGDDGRLTLSENDIHVAGDITARQVLFPLAPGLLVPAWSLVVFTQGDADWYAVVDAETGDLLWRKNIRSHVSAHDARFRVYVQDDGTTPADSPSPHSPTTAAPNSQYQPPGIAPTIVSMHTAQNLVASPNGWIDDCPGGVCGLDQSQTLGNNVIACLDREAGLDQDICDTGINSVLDGDGRPQGNPDANGRGLAFLGTMPRDFETSYLPPPQNNNPESGQSATGNDPADNYFRRGALTQLFYLTNWYHDRVFALGFDEAAGNFQNTNFSGMGVGGDRVQADAQNTPGVNTASFATPPDGIAGRMQTGRYIGPILDRDGGLDAEIVLHELTHGMSNRLIGDAAGLNWDVGEAIGEGWGDFYALALLNNTDADDPDDRYAFGSYANFSFNGLLDNYVYGIRRFPYSTDNTVNPLTWGDIDDVTNDQSGGIAPSPLPLNDRGGLERHNAGELWALSLWEVRSRIIADPAGANGSVPAGNQTALQLVTDAMKMTPLEPSFLDARNALLDADCATNACANEDSIWGGFADRGLGYGAHAPYFLVQALQAGHMAVGESFEMPKLHIASDADVTIDDAVANNNGAIDPGEAVRLTVRLTNPWRAANKGIANATATLATLTPGVTVYDMNSTYGAIPAQGNAQGDAFVIALDPLVACGSAIDFVLTTNSALGPSQTTFRLRVGNAGPAGAPITYTANLNPVLPIPDLAPRGVQSQLTIADDLQIVDLNLRIDSLSHTKTGDLTAMLRSPEGIGVDLIARIGASVGGADTGDNLIDMVIDDDLPAIAANDMAQANAAQAPFTKSWLPISNSPWAPAPDPVGSLSRYDGRSTAGTWTLLVSDEVLNEAGTLNQWSVIVTPRLFGCQNFAPAVSISASKSVTGTFRVGGNVTYTVVLTNSGTANQGDNPGDEFNDVLPAGLTLVSANASSGAASTNGNTVEWNGSLAPLGGSTTITIQATVDPGTQGTTIVNQGGFFFDADNDGVNDTLLLTDDPAMGGAADPTSFAVGFADVTASKTVATNGTRGSLATYTVVLANSSAGDAALDNVGDEFSDVLPAGLSLVGASATSGTAFADIGTRTVTWNGSLPAGDSVTITITATVDADASGTLSNQGTVNFDADLDGNHDTVRVTDDPGSAGTNEPTDFLVQFAQLTGTKTVAGPFTRGSTATYTIMLSNTGSAATADNTGDEFTDALPGGLTLVSAVATSGTVDANFGTDTVTWNGGLGAGGSVTITITATIDPDTLGNIIANQAAIAFDSNLDASNESAGVTDDPGTPAPADPTAFTVIGAQLAATKTVAGTFLPGQPVTYTLILTNVGNATAVDLLADELTDVLPAGLTLDSATSPDGVTAAVGNTVTWNGALTPGANATITLVATVALDAMGTISNQADLAFDHDLDGTADATGQSDDPGLPGVADATVFTVASGADLQASKSNGVAAVVAGSDTIYVIQVANGGPQAVIGASVVDTLPPELSGAEWTCSATGTTCPAPAGTGDINQLVDLPVNAVITFNLIANVSGNIGGNVTNTVVISTPDGITEVDGNDNSASDTDVIQPIGIFRDGFEEPPMNKLGSPPSAKTQALGARR